MATHILYIREAVTEIRAWKEEHSRLHDRAEGAAEVRRTFTGVLVKFTEKAIPAGGVAALVSWWLGQRP